MEHYPESTSAKQKPKSAIPRAKMFLRARLGWLWGYPLAVKNGEIHWQQLYYPMPWDTATLTVTQSNLASASVFRNKLISDFPRALPKLVGNSDEWSAGVTLKLQALRHILDGERVDPLDVLLTPTIKNGKRLHRQACKLCQQHPELKSVAEGFVWWLSLDSKVLTQALQWLEQEREALGKLAEHSDHNIDLVRISAVMFTLTGLTTRQTVSRLLSFVLHPNWKVDVLPDQQQWVTRLKEMRQDFRYDAPKIIRLLAEPQRQQVPEKQTLKSHDWLLWAESLLLKPRRERRQHLDITHWLFPPALLDTWLNVKQQLNQQIRELQQALRETQQQLLLIEQQIELLYQQGEQLKQQLLKLPHNSPDTKQPRIEIAGQKRANYEHLQQLKEQYEDLADHMNNRLDQLLPASDEDKSTTIPEDDQQTNRNKTAQILSYIPHQQNLPVLIDFSLKHARYLQSFQRLSQQLQIQHDWYAPDGLLRMVWYWQYLQHTCPREKVSNLPIMLDSVFTYLRQAKDGEQLNRRLMPWSDLLKLPISDNRIPPEIFDYDLVVYNEGFDERDTLLKLLGELCDHRMINSDDAKQFKTFYEDTPRHWPHTDYFTALQEHGIQLRDDLWNNEYHDLDKVMNGNYDMEYFLSLTDKWDLRQLADNDDTDDDDSTDIINALPAAAHLTTHGFPDAADYFTGQKQWQVLAARKPMIQQFASVKKPLPPPRLQVETLPATLLTSWQPYPESLHPALTQLYRYHPQAEKAALRILSGHFPPREGLLQEIATLEQKIPTIQKQAQQQAMQKRLTNLHQRLVQVPKITARQIEKLQQKLTHAAFTGLLNAWQQSSRQVMEQLVVERLYLTELPAQWSQDKRKIRSLFALTGLGKPERKLAGLLLQANLAGEDQDLRSLPANRNWLEKMEQAGIATASWLDNTIFNANSKLPSGEQAALTLRFADDVFDVLQMGDHFETCLSHDDFNFFSVVANAADLNKRVVYAYDERGRIQGRCLLGISEEKQLLSFHPYSHDNSNAFTLALGEFIAHLEQTMSIHRSATGRIPLLLAYDWYDDGAQTIMPEYAALKKGSTFLQQLKTLAPGQILTAYQQAIAPQVLNHEAVRQLLELKTIHSSPDHLFALYQQAREMQCSSIRLNQAIVNALLRLEDVPHEKIWPLTQDWIYRHILDGLLQNQWYSQPHMDLLLSQHPVLLLRLIRSLLPKTRRWSGYLVSDMHVYQARALLALHRPRKAEAAYQNALNKYRGGHYNIRHFSTEMIWQELSELPHLQSGSAQ